MTQRTTSNHYDTGFRTQTKEGKGTETKGGRRSDQKNTKATAKWIAT